MDEDGFEESRSAASVNDVDAMHRPRLAVDDDSPFLDMPHGGASNARTSFTAPDRLASHPGIVWVRATDLLSASTGRIAGRGIDFEANLARRVRRTPATTRRAIRERADRLPPLSEFGQSTDHPPFSHYRLGRR